jgi:DNA-binding LacI/PurR family transcriptional regulator
MWRTAARRRMFGVVALAALLALTACGGAIDRVASAGGEVNPATSEDAEAMDADAQALAFAECMREEGIDIPDPGPDQEGLSSALHEAEESYNRETYDQALTACEELLTHRDHDRGDHAPDDEMMLELAECLREQGLDVPDDLFQGGALHDVEDEEFRAAFEECRDEVAGGDHQ